MSAGEEERCNALTACSGDRLQVYRQAAQHSLAPLGILYGPGWWWCSGWSAPARLLASTQSCTLAAVCVSVSCRAIWVCCRALQTTDDWLGPLLGETCKNVQFLRRVSFKFDFITTIASIMIYSQIIKFAISPDSLLARKNIIFEELPCCSRPESAVTLCSTAARASVFTKLSCDQHDTARITTSVILDSDFWSPSDIMSSSPSTTPAPPPPLPDPLLAAANVQRLLQFYRTLAPYTIGGPSSTSLETPSPGQQQQQQQQLHSPRPPADQRFFRKFPPFPWFPRAPMMPPGPPLAHPFMAKCEEAPGMSGHRKRQHSSDNSSQPIFSPRDRDSSRLDICVNWLAASQSVSVLSVKTQWNID